MTRLTPRASRIDGRRFRWSPCKTRLLPSMTPPQPSAFFKALSHCSSSFGFSSSCSTTVTSFPPRPFLSMRTTAFAGGFGASGVRLPPSAAKGLLKGSSVMLVPGGGEEAIGAVDVRKELHGTGAAEFGVGFVEPGRDVFVLGAVERAGDVDDARAGVARGRLEQFALRKLLELDPPARVGSAAERADL